MLLSCFASLCRARRVTRIFAGSGLDRFRNDLLVGDFTGDVYIVHGSEDAVVRVDNSARLRDACIKANEVTRVVVKGGGHNGLVPSLGQHVPVETLITFCRDM